MKQAARKAKKAMLDACYRLGSCLIYSSTLKTEVTDSSKTPANFLGTIQH
jgi:hypothetical protein